MLQDFPDNKSKVISINRSSLIFDHVIAYIIDDKYPYPLKYFTELDYYDINYDKSKLYYPHKNTYDKLELLSKNVTEVNNLLVKTYELENKIYDLESKIETITAHIYYDLKNSGKCNYQECSNISGYDLFCIEHKTVFKNRCGFKSPTNETYCTNITNDNVKYCTNHSERSKFCDNKYCRKLRIIDSKFCIIHS